jgi:drug/metabolite transporter (DMT)-like permease
MAVVLAFLSAFLYGCADFAGGKASRHSPATTVTITSHLSGLLVLLPVAFFVPVAHMSTAGWTQAIMFGALGGLVGAIGLLLLYAALASGTMSIVSPVTATSAAIVPLVAGFIAGERLGAWAIVGLVFAIAAIGLVSLGHDTSESDDMGKTVRMSIIAGICFGLFYVALARANHSPDGVRLPAGVWPLVATRAMAFCITVVVTIVRKEPLILQPSRRIFVIALGAGDIGANALFLVASSFGLLAVTGPIASLYPVSTVLLARFIDHESLKPIQWIGLILAGAALILVSL